MAAIQSKAKDLSESVAKLRKNHCDENFRKEMHGLFNQFLLRFDAAEMWGFPFLDKEGKVKYLSNRFTKSPLSQIERCRCGKQINLNQEDWHVDENGCHFHPGKLHYSERRKGDVYLCCRQMYPSIGCVRRPHHVSKTRAFWGDNFVKTETKKISFLPNLPNIFGLDCEMVYTTVGMEVVKVTVLSVFCEVVYDTFVQPHHPVIDFNTEFSGIDESHLADVTVDLKQVQSVLLNLFDADTILVGHGLENDLLCLNLCHQKVIDTSIVFAHEKGFPYRHSLKFLAKTYLAKDIHCNSKGHDSTEDAKTCLELIGREIFCRTSKKKKAMMLVNATLPKILQWPMDMNNNNNPLPNIVFGQRYSGLPLTYRPTLFWNQTWTTVHPGFSVTSSVCVPCGTVDTCPPPHLPPFPPIFQPPCPECEQCLQMQQSLPFQNTKFIDVGYIG